jgi:hypothetical protein
MDTAVSSRNDETEDVGAACLPAGIEIESGTNLSANRGGTFISTSAPLIANKQSRYVP